MGIVREDELREIEREAKNLGKEDKLFAFILDRGKTEREKGYSIEPYHYSFFHANNNYMVIDCPGHKDFVRNMIQGAVQSDAGILVVAADDYETALMARKSIGGGWVIGQAREHAYIAKVLGIGQIIVVISKMDVPKVNWQETSFNEASAKVIRFLEKLGYSKENIICLPVGGRPPLAYGTNVVKMEGRPNWYQGPTFLEALALLKPPPRYTSLPLRVPIEKVYSNIPGTLVVCGKIESGRVAVGDRVVVEPSHVSAHVRSIRMRDERGPVGVREWSTMNEAQAGHIVGLGISGVEMTDVTHMLLGNMLCHSDSPSKVACEFEADICVVWHPSAIAAGYSPRIHIGTLSSRCTITNILHKKDMSTDKTVLSPPCITKGDIARVRLKVAEPIAIEPYTEIPPLGRFVLRDGLTVAGGIVTEVCPRK
jgi:elongation factor 1-alpha